MKIANMNQLIAFMAEELVRLRNGETTPESANAVADVSEKIIASVQTEISYNELRGGNFNVKFMEEEPKHPVNLGDSPIEELNINTRGENCLKRRNIRTVGALLLLSESDLLKTPNLGRRSLKEIKGALEKHGLHLRAK